MPGLLAALPGGAGWVLARAVSVGVRSRPPACTARGKQVAPQKKRRSGAVGAGCRRTRSRLHAMDDAAHALTRLHREGGCQPRGLAPHQSSGVRHGALAGRRQRAHPRRCGPPGQRRCRPARSPPLHSAVRGPGPGAALHGREHLGVRFTTDSVRATVHATDLLRCFRTAWARAAAAPARCAQRGRVTARVRAAGPQAHCARPRRRRPTLPQTMPPDAASAPSRTRPSLCRLPADT